MNAWSRLSAKCFQQESSIPDAGEIDLLKMLRIQNRALVKTEPYATKIHGARSGTMKFSITNTLRTFVN